MKCNRIALAAIICLLLAWFVGLTVVYYRALDNKRTVYVAPPTELPATTRISSWHSTEPPFGQTVLAIWYESDGTATPRIVKQLYGAYYYVTPGLQSSVTNVPPAWWTEEVP